MIEKIKDYGLYIIALLIIAVVVIGVQKCEGDSKHKAEIAQFDQTVTALSDSIRKTVNSKGDTVYSEKVVYGDLNDITETEYFKQLSKEKQAYYLDLKKTKGLLAASQETIQKQGELIALLTDTVGVRSDSTVCYDYGDKIIVPDTTVNKLTYSGDITFEREKVKLAIKYDYKVQISSKVKEYKKDGSIVIEHTLDDPNAKIVQGESFLAPAPKKTFWQKAWSVTKDVLKISGGFVTGYTAGKLTK